MMKKFFLSATLLLGFSISILGMEKTLGIKEAGTAATAQIRTAIGKILYQETARGSKPIPVARLDQLIAQALAPYGATPTPIPGETLAIKEAGAAATAQIRTAIGKILYQETARGSKPIPVARLDQLTGQATDALAAAAPAPGKGKGPAVPPPAAPAPAAAVATAAAAPRPAPE